MPEMITVIVNGRQMQVSSGTTAIAALGTNSLITRHSVRGKERGPLCGMGICQECRVCIDGIMHRLACQTACRDGMRIDTDEAVS